MKKINSVILFVFCLVLFTSCTCVNYNNPNSHIGNLVLDTIPIYRGGEIWYYKYQTSYISEETGDAILKTLILRPEYHKFVPGDTIKFDKPFSKEYKEKKTQKKTNNFVE